MRITDPRPWSNKYQKIKRKIMEYLSPNSSPCMLHACTRVCTHSCALAFEKQMLIWCVFLSYSPFYCFETESLSLNLTLSNLARLAGQRAAKIHLSLQYQCWKNKCGRNIWYFMWFSGHWNPFHAHTTNTLLNEPSPHYHLQSTS